jgi:hypothetical protein
MKRAPAALAVLLCSSVPAGAADWADIASRFGVEGYGDFRLVMPSDQQSWMDRGLGKTRYGDPDQEPKFRLGEIIAEGHLQVTGALMALAVLRYEPRQRTMLDVTEAYLRYRPVSLSPFRWSVKLGAFFPPISLENTELGWTSPWTLSPSAINTWVGEELRTIGGEARAEWRMEGRTLSATGALYGWNDPTGILLAGRGWSISDWVTGLNDRPWLPDVYAAAARLPVPSRTYEFLEIDRRVGWYAGASWDEAGLGHLEVLRYDNRADPTVTRHQIAWETKFWSGGASTHFGPFTLLAQGMHGWTYIKPSPFFDSETYFDAAYVLLGWERGDWRLAGRFDVFSTEEEHPGTSVLMSEHGHAVTAAANWLPNDWLRITGEVLRVESWRLQRVRMNIDPHQTETQLQLSAKLYF